MLRWSWPNWITVSLMGIVLYSGLVAAMRLMAPAEAAAEAHETPAQEAHETALEELAELL